MIVRLWLHSIRLVLFYFKLGHVEFWLILYTKNVCLTLTHFFPWFQTSTPCRSQLKQAPSNIHTVFTWYTHCPHLIYTLSSSNIHTVLTWYTHCLHLIYTLSSPDIHTILTWYTQNNNFQTGIRSLLVVRYCCEYMLQFIERLSSYAVIAKLCL